MNGIDLDEIEKNKFWKGVLSDMLAAAVIIVICLCIYDSVQTTKMLEAGYEYRRVPVSVKTESQYKYEWIKIGSPEHKEAAVTPERSEE